MFFYYFSHGFIASKSISITLETPLGTLPVLEYDGKILSQSVTIARFLAKEFGIAGYTNMQQAMADMIVDTITDVQLGKRQNLVV